MSLPVVKKDEIDISCPIFVSTLKCTSSPHISLIGHSKMELTDVDFSFQKFHWLFESNEANKGYFLTTLAILKK